MELLVARLVGENCVTADAGETLYAPLVEALRKGDVTLDFAGVNVFASPFLNASIGRLLGDFSVEVLRARLKLVNLSPSGDELVRRVIANSAAFYRRNLDQQEAIAEAIRSATDR